MRHTLFAGFSALAFLVASPRPVEAAPITYQVNQTIGAGSVIGSVQTDGTTGLLGASNITAFSLDLNGAGGVTYHLMSGSSAVLVVGSDLTATPTNLLFNFSGIDNGYLLFQQTLFTGTRYYCNATSSTDCYQGATVAPQSINDPSAQTAPRAGTQIIGTALTAIPEPASLALVTMGVVGLGAARRKFLRSRIAP